jgi:hypothetical protein
MSERDMRLIIEKCAIESLATFQTIRHSGGYDYVYTIAPGIVPVLDELLHAPNSAPS